MLQGEQARDALQAAILKQTTDDLAALGEVATLALLERGRARELSGVIARGGVIGLPHASVADCGHQSTVAVHD